MSLPVTLICLKCRKTQIEDGQEYCQHCNCDALWEVEDETDEEEVS